MNSALLAAASGSGPSPLWYATRGTGLITTVLLTASVVLGVITTIRFATPHWPRFVTAGLHRNVSLLVLAFLTVHIVTAELDTYAPVGWFAVVVPFMSAYRPVWLGLGTLAVDLLLAVTITSGLRLKIGHRAWRIVHWSAYACWPLAIVHGLGTGTDTRLGWTLALNAACVMAVLGALWWRLSVGWPAHARARISTAALSAVLPVAAVGWLVLGPLQPGWARRAGTPSRLVAQPATATTRAAGPAPNAAVARDFPAAAFSGQFTGTVAESQPNDAGQVAVRVQGATTGPAAGVLSIVIDGQPSGGGGVSLTASQVSFGPASQPDSYRGQITGLNGTTIQAALSRGSGASRLLTVRLQLGSNRATGTYQFGPSQ